MWLPRPRFSVRRLMLAVALVAVALIFYIRVARPWYDRRSARFHERVSYHQTLWIWERGSRQRGCVVIVTPQLRAYHNAMAAKYDWAERYPWLPVSPDPPEPE